MTTYIALSFTTDEMERVEAALALLQDIDDANGHADESRKTRDLIARIQTGEAVIGSSKVAE